MKIGLIDVDGHNFPSLPLMKISAWHKARGDTVEKHTAKTFLPVYRYDKAYASKVFSFTPDLAYPIQAEEVVCGGTGYDLQTVLPAEVESCYPDYSLYGITDTSYGFLTRGCPRRCKFCIVSEKEGCVSRQVADLSSFHGQQNYIKLMDANLLACEDRERLLLQLAESGAKVDFTQGLDIRLADRDVIELLDRIKTKMIHFAWDNPREDLTPHFERFGNQSCLKDYRRRAVYVLTNFDSTHEEDLARVYILRSLDFDPYIMIYNKHCFVNAKTQRLYPMKLLLQRFTMEQISHFKQVWLLQRWVNNKIIFRSCERFEDYRPEVG